MSRSAQNQQQICALCQKGLQIAVESCARMIKTPLRVVVTDSWRSDRRISLVEKQPMFGVYLGIQGTFRGGLLLLLAEERARSLVESLLPGHGNIDLLREPASSSLKEFGNILSSAFLASLDRLRSLQALPGPPTLARAPGVDLFETYRQQHGRSALIVRAQLSCHLSDQEVPFAETFLYFDSQTLSLLAESPPLF